MPTVSDVKQAGLVEEHVVQLSEGEQLKKQTLYLALASSLQEKSNQISGAKKSVRGESNSAKQDHVFAPQTPQSFLSLQWGREFKISGQIGKSGQKDKLTFSSLAHQIEQSISKGFSEIEVVDAVIRAIAPGLQLCSYLGAKTDLTLPTLRRILKSHYQETGATELYKHLTSEA